jgi:hypothetical protein
MNAESESQIKEEQKPVDFSEFLETIPPSTLTFVSFPGEVKRYGPSRYYDHHEIILPEVQLHCSNDTCNGMRFFRCKGKNATHVNQEFKFIYITYQCSNCRNTEKIFSLAIKMNSEQNNLGQCYKFGELPVYGPPTPSRLITLIGPDRELFLKGRRCENQGLGVGAFVYYRRVVENQKNRILDKIIKVSNKLNTPESTIDILEKAKTETQFSKALESVKNAIPQTLLINGHNPMTLLYSALSEGLHDQSDEHCLEIASSVRIILGELSERLSQALKDEAELNNALSKLMNAKKGE